MKLDSKITNSIILLVLMVTSFSVLAFKTGWEAHKHRSVPPLPDGIYIGTNGIVSSIDRGRATRITAQATNVTVYTRRGMVATTEIRLP